MGTENSNGSQAVRSNGTTNGQSSSPPREETDRLVMIKLAEITGLVKGAEEEYSVIIKVLPTDDNDRYKVKQKFRQVKSCTLHFTLDSFSTSFSRSC